MFKNRMFLYCCSLSTHPLNQVKLSSFSFGQESVKSTMIGGEFPTPTPCQKFLLPPLHLPSPSPLPPPSSLPTSALCQDSHLAMNTIFSFFFYLNILSKIVGEVS